MPGDVADRGPDLLFAVVALHLKLVDAAQLGEVVAALSEGGGRSAAEILVARGYLSPARARMLEPVVAAAVEDHDGDVIAAIGTFGAFGGNPFVEQTVIRGAGVSATLPRADAAPAAAAAAERYEVVRELGRGGLGRVMLALDRGLMGREVAMKLLLDDGTGPARSHEPSPSTPRARDRFLEEAQITSRLQHPNIVAVHELGTRPGGELYYTMSVVGGRSLKDEIRAAHDRLGSGDVGAEQWGVERLKLLQAFQGLCHGLSYAHSRGVIHRDVKPANVMVGDHGEVIVVDWGLAKVGRRGDAPPDPSAGSSDRELERQIRTLRSEEGRATLEGTVTGTPAYMAPEQAEGRIHDVDERSDVYALGAVLFEILTGRPPFEGRSAQEVLAKVTSRSVPDPRSLGGRLPVPDDLAAICLHAMRRAREERYPSVRALLEDIVLAVEGSKERERRHAEAERLVAAGRVRSAEYEELRREHRRLDAQAKEAGSRFKGGEPVEEKAGWWRQQDAAEAAGHAILTAFAEAERLFHRALEQEDGHRAAREGLADLYYGQFLAAEGEDDADFRYYGDLVRTYHDGKYARELSGAGSISIDSEPPGAELFLHRYDERERRLLPVPWRAPAGWQPRLRQGESATSAGWYLAPLSGDPEASCGRTPIAGLEAPMGGYLAILRMPGFRDLRLSLQVARNEDVRTSVRLYTEEEIGGEGFVCVPRGSFTAGGDPAALAPWPRQRRELDDFFIARGPVTCEEYVEFLNDLGARDPAGARRHAPRWQNDGGMHWIEEPEGVWRWPEERDDRGILWRAGEPVVEVSCIDAEAYCAWRAARDGRPYRLPEEAEWEKAARGADGRRFPFGRHYDASWCNGGGASRLDGGPRRGPVGEFPVDESPYGVRDLAGNVCDWCAGLLLEDQHWRVARGGFWCGSVLYSHAATRYGVGPSDPFAFIGFRLAASPGKPVPMDS